MEISRYFVHGSSYIDENVEIGEGTKIWHFCHIQSGAKIGKYCSIGQNVNIANNVVIGDGVKIQNNVSIYEGVELEDGVFCGPSCVFTNDLTPRAGFPKGRKNYKKTLVCEGASIGANATIVCGHIVGRYAMIAAGAVVTKNVPDYALIVGVPGKQTGFVCECGNLLSGDEICKVCGKEYNNKLMFYPGGGKRIHFRRKRLIFLWNFLDFYRHSFDMDGGSYVY